MGPLIKILSLDQVTHDVIRIITSRPRHIQFIPGQATELSINKQGWEEEKRPFTFTSLPEDDHLEFIIKTYSDHHGMTEQLTFLKTGEELFIHDVFGTINYRGAGMFIAGGAGVTPFLSILKMLDSKGETPKNKLIFANKTRADIILEKELSLMLGNNFINVLSNEDFPGYEHGFISEELIQNSIDTSDPYFYICGPDPMMNAIERHLAALKISPAMVVKEAF